jgi:hypothetical protein
VSQSSSLCFHVVCCCTSVKADVLCVIQGLAARQANSSVITEIVFAPPGSAMATTTVETEAMNKTAVSRS